MNYMYDVLLNFNDFPYDIFEWNKDDKINHIRKIPLFKLKTTDLSNLINKNVRLDNDFLNKIYIKTELYNKKNLDYAFIATDGKIAFAFSYNTKLKYSQLFLDEEEEAINYSLNLNFYDIKYDIINNKNIDLLKTRNETYMRRFIYSQLKKIKNKDKLNFIFLECFNKKSEDVLNDLYHELENDFENIYYKLYKILKKTAIKR